MLNENEISKKVFDIIDHPADTQARTAISGLRDIQAVIELSEHLGNSPEQTIKMIQTEIEWNVNFWHNYHMERYNERVKTNG